MLDPQPYDQPASKFVDDSAVGRLRLNGQRAEQRGCVGPGVGAVIELSRDDVGVEGEHLEAAGLLVTVEGGGDALDLGDGAAGRGDDVFRGDDLGDGFEQAGLGAGGMEGAGLVGGFERAAEGAGEDGERAGDGEQQDGAGVVRGGAAEVPGAEQGGEPARGGGEPRGDPHQGGEEAQHGEADDGHQHGGGDDGEPFEAGVADERSVDRAAGELQLEDEQRAERDDRDINEDALAPGVGWAAAFAARRDDGLAGRAIGGDGLGDERERAGADRDVPGEGGQADGQEAAAEGFVEGRHEAEQRDEAHPDQGAE